VLTLYQTEWCVYSHRVRRLLTELCLDYMCVNVAPAGEERADLKELTGQTEIPVLIDDGQVVSGSDAILEHLHSRYPATPATPQHHKTGEFRYVKQCADEPEAVLEHLRSLLEERRLYVVSETRLPFNGRPSYERVAVADAALAEAGADEADSAAGATAGGAPPRTARKSSGLGAAEATTVATTVEEMAEVGVVGDYILVQIASTAVWKRIIKTDPATVGAITMRIGIWPLPGDPGCSGVSIEDPVAGAWIAGSTESVWAARQARSRIKELFDEL
jgi:glutaredoxin 3